MPQRLGLRPSRGNRSVNLARLARPLALQPRRQQEGVCGGRFCHGLSIAGARLSRSFALHHTLVKSVTTLEGEPPGEPHAPQDLRDDTLEPARKGPLEFRLQPADAARQAEA